MKIPIKKGDHVIVNNWNDLNFDQNNYLRSKVFFEVIDVIDDGKTPFIDVGYRIPLYMSRFSKIEKTKPDPNKPKILFLEFDLPIDLCGEEDIKNYFKGYTKMSPIFMDILSKKDPGIYIDFKKYDDIYRMENDFYVNNMKIRDYDFVFFGLISKFTTICKMLISYCCKYDIPYLKYGTYKEYNSKDYEFDFIKSLGLPYIPSILTSKLSNKILEDIKKIGYPLILKNIYLNQGRGISVINNEQELKNEFYYNVEPKLVQKLLANNCEYRVLLIKNKVILVLKKDKISKITKEEIDKRKIKIGTLPNQVLDMCEFISKNLFCDILGIDVIQDIDSKKYYIVEMNSAPHLAMFSVVSGVNIMELISSYILEEVNKKSKQTKIIYNI